MTSLTPSLKDPKLFAKLKINTFKKKLDILNNVKSISPAVKKGLSRNLKFTLKESWVSKRSVREVTLHESSVENDNSTGWVILEIFIICDILLQNLNSVINLILEYCGGILSKNVN